MSDSTRAVLRFHRSAAHRGHSALLAVGPCFATCSFGRFSALAQSAGAHSPALGIRRGRPADWRRRIEMLWGGRRGNGNFARTRTPIVGATSFGVATKCLVEANCHLRSVPTAIDGNLIGRGAVQHRYRRGYRDRQARRREPSRRGPRASLASASTASSASRMTSERPVPRGCRSPNTTCWFCLQARAHATPFSGKLRTSRMAVRLSPYRVQAVIIFPEL